ncbi:uncharacterized protein BDW47DRAFT_92377 [Aspergillus candidus]|uniref:Uncharacterized protein n=1 Tax=Aspergillus candidus TaxID=41067 RepID=A0A2I2EYP3_ASPCN|nr:hypothetical protein BDW47DRAFT_92377 [Aspergillus candidus]PLB33495.1 hypothetical protein BDW47DRAFT_92377 [Aspergillus candidus]
MAAHSELAALAQIVAGPSFHYERDEIAPILIEHVQRSRINTSKRIDNCILVCVASCVGYQGIPVDRLEQMANASIAGGGCTFPRQFLFLFNRLERLGIFLHQISEEEMLADAASAAGHFSIFCVFEKSYTNTNSKDDRKNRKVQHAVLYGGSSDSGPIYKDFQFSKKGSAGREPLDRTEYLKGWTLLQVTRVESSRFDERRPPLDDRNRNLQMRLCRSWDQQDLANPQARSSVVQYFQLTGVILDAGRKQN